MIARLVKSGDDLGVELWVSSPAKRLVTLLAAWRAPDVGLGRT